MRVTPATKTDIAKLESWYKGHNEPLPPLEEAYGFVIRDILYFELIPLGKYRYFMNNLITNPLNDGFTSYDGGCCFVDFILSKCREEGKIIEATTIHHSMVKLCLREAQDHLEVRNNYHLIFRS